ncbi:MAG: hypothetical protein K2I30_03865 [Clostridia bacterium]|nr:hypothetical protein [Clostridia bacterium]
MIAVLILCIITLVFVIVNTALVATLHRINLKLASKHTKKENGKNVAAQSNELKDNAERNVIEG